MTGNPPVYYVSADGYYSQLSFFHYAMIVVIWKGEK